jgi:hypothetical protein
MYPKVYTTLTGSQSVRLTFSKLYIHVWRICQCGKMGSLVLINEDAKFQWEIECQNTCRKVKSDCDVCPKEDRCKELTNQMRNTGRRID